MPSGDDVLTAYPLDDAGAPDGERGRVILAVDHPDSVQHHGGALVVGPDELLYLGLGDGGGLGDPHGNAQDETTLLGKVIRIVPTPGGAEPYRIPPDNPFVDEPGVAPEIWVMGVRNPFRMSTDPDTGDLWLGDVGQSCWEELDRLPTGADDAGGANLGWDHVEGSHPFEGGTVPGRELGPVQEHPHARRVVRDRGRLRAPILGRADAGRAAPLLGLLQGRPGRAGRRREHERTPPARHGPRGREPDRRRARPDREPVDPHPRR